MSFIISISGIILRTVLVPVRDFLIPTSCMKKMEEIVKTVALSSMCE